MKTNKLFQVSTLNDLMLGDYNGTCSVKELLKHGDTGIGTYDGLDGEAIILNGKAYNGRANGVVSEMSEEDSLPFTTVAFFDEKVKEQVISFESIEDFKTLLSKELVSTHYFYMIKMEGKFNVRVRSCFKQDKPYEPLYKVAKDQREFEYHDIEGYVVGVFCPNYVEGMNLPGWHIHFISKDLTKGGHILKLSGENIQYKLNKLNEWDLRLPNTKEFSSFNLKEDLSKKTEAVEGSSK